MSLNRIFMADRERLMESIFLQTASVGNSNRLRPTNEMHLDVWISPVYVAI